MYTISAAGGAARRAPLYPLSILISKISFRKKSKKR